MAESESDLFLPLGVTEILFLLNSATPENLSVVDSDGTVYGWLKTQEGIQKKNNSSGRVQLWSGIARYGVSFEDLEEATVFLQGYFACTFKLRPRSDILSHIESIQKLGNLNYEDVMKKLLDFQLYYDQE